MTDASAKPKSRSSYRASSLRQNAASSIVNASTVNAPFSMPFKEALLGGESDPHPQQIVDLG